MRGGGACTALGGAGPSPWPPIFGGTHTGRSKKAVSIPTQEVSLPPSPELSAFSSQVHRLRDIWRIVTLNRKVAFGLGIITFFVLVAIFGPIILTRDPNAFSIDILAPPSVSHWLGTTQTGQDVFLQVVIGTRVSLILGFATGLIGTIIYAILAETGLEYLGLGDVTTVSWGTIFYWAGNNDAILLGAWWWIIPPGLCIALLGAGLAFINFGIDEIANPRLRKESNPKQL